MLNIVERSITADLLVDELKEVFGAAGGPPQVLRLDNGPEMISQALQQFATAEPVSPSIPPGTPWNNGHIESFNNRLRKECLNRHHWNTLIEARGVISNFKEDHNHRLWTNYAPSSPRNTPPQHLPNNTKSPSVQHHSLIAKHEARQI
jgi:transposase InsO family protein